MREIVNGVYFEDAYGSGNVGCIATTEGAVLIDSPMLPQDAWDWLKKIGSVTKQGVTALINTDYHLEHVLGNCFFPPTVTIAHQATWLEMQHYDEAFLQRYLSHQKENQAFQSFDLSKARVVLPELTMTADMTVYKGDTELRLLFAGGHTPASIMVHVPQARLLFTGNVVVKDEHPAMSHANSLKWLHALEMIRAMDNVDTVVPGHGGVCDVSATETLIQYINQMRDRVYECYQMGYTRRETVDKVKMEGFFSVLAHKRAETERRIRASVERAYDEFKKGNPKRQH